MEDYEKFFAEYLQPACESMIKSNDDFDPYLACAVYGVRGMAHSFQDMDKVFDFLREQAKEQIKPYAVN